MSRVPGHKIGRLRDIAIRLPDTEASLQDGSGYYGPRLLNIRNCQWSNVGASQILDTHVEGFGFMITSQIKGRCLSDAVYDWPGVQCLANPSLD